MKREARREAVAQSNSFTAGGARLTWKLERNFLFSAKTQLSPAPANLAPESRSTENAIEISCYRLSSLTLLLQLFCTAIVFIVVMFNLSSSSSALALCNSFTMHLPQHRAPSQTACPMVQGPAAASSALGPLHSLLLRRQLRTGHASYHCTGELSLTNAELRDQGWGQLSPRPLFDRFELYKDLSIPRILRLLPL